MTFNPSNHLRQIERRQRQPDGSYVKVANDREQETTGV